jgi:hypothetical protein
MKRATSATYGPVKYSDDMTMKVCNCPIHQGALVPLEKFWYYKKGKRKGLPFCRCIDGTKLSKGLNPKRSGLVPYARVRFIFLELEFRLGRAEACRRVGVSARSFWPRHEGGTRPNYTKQLRKDVVVRAITVLRAAREIDEARHKDSIRHGAAARGRTERTPVKRREFNGKNEFENELRRNHSKRVKASKN